MKLITKDTDYAIVALLALNARRATPVSAADLSEQSGIAYPFLRCILRKLAGAGIVASRRGTGGGFSLRRAMETVTVGEIAEIFQGKVTLLNCRTGSDPCDRAERCVLRRKLLTLESRLAADLMNASIASLARDDAPAAALDG